MPADAGLCVYVITNGSPVVYVGQSGNLEKRLRRHNEGRACWFTRLEGGFWRVLWQTPAASRAEARCIELNLICALNDGEGLPCLPFRPTRWNRTAGDHWHRLRRSGELRLPAGTVSRQEFQLERDKAYKCNIHAHGPMFTMEDPSWPEVREVLADLGLELIVRPGRSPKGERKRWTVDRRGTVHTVGMDKSGTPRDFINLAHDYFGAKVKARRAKKIAAMKGSKGRGSE